MIYGKQHLLSPGLSEASRKIRMYHSSRVVHFVWGQQQFVHKRRMQNCRCLNLQHLSVYDKGRMALAEHIRMTSNPETSMRSLAALMPSFTKAPVPQGQRTPTRGGLLIIIFWFFKVADLITYTPSFHVTGRWSPREWLSKMTVKASNNGNFGELGW